MTATDSDTGLDGTMAYSLTSHTTTFSIEEDTGKIILIQTLDRETLAQYEIVVEASDRSTTTQKTGTTTVTVTLDDVNEFAPSCTALFNVNTVLPITIGNVVQSLGCTDSDSGVNAQLTYSITSGNTNTDFAILVNGDIVYNKQPTQSSYQLQITIADSATPPKSTKSTVIVNVETDPQFTNLPGSITVPEDAAFASVQFTVSGNSASGQKTYTIISGNGGGKFVLDAYTGELMVLSTLDRETTDSYTLGVRITDPVFSRTADSTIGVTVSDANDQTPAFAQNLYDLAAAEILPSQYSYKHFRRDRHGSRYQC